jgi:hypothetical protein
MIPQDILEVPEIAEAVDLLKESSSTEAELMQYDRYLDEIRIQNTLTESAAEAKAQKAEAKTQTAEAKAQTAEANQKIMKLIDFASKNGSSINEIANALDMTEQEIKELMK